MSIDLNAAQIWGKVNCDKGPVLFACISSNIHKFDFQFALAKNYKIYCFKIR